MAAKKFRPSVDQLQEALEVAQQIAKLEARLAELLGSEASVTPKAPSQPSAAEQSPKRRKLSAAARARIVAAQKARWAKIKNQKASNA